ncbi:MAG: cation:proton antiporter [Candidatus Saganbacteria bacterium]|nr:cation:proton antiporter [Candidatus Saganbacteria bacterium]
MSQIAQMVQLLEQQAFFAAAVLLILGFVFSLLARVVNLPRVTGYIIAGILLGPSVFKVFTDQALSQLEFMPQFALGIIAVIIGAGLSFTLIKRLGLGLLIITLFESLGAFFLVFCGLSLLKMPLEAVLPLAAISAATAPAATVAVIREFHAVGPFTETTLAVVALDDAIAITLFGLIMTLDLKNISGLGDAALHSLSESFWEIVLAVVIGLALALLAHLLLKLTREISDALIVMIGIVLLGVTLATVADVSHLLANMVLGMVLVNISAKNSEVVTGLERAAPPIFVFFFVLAGAHLDLAIFIDSGWTMLFWGLVFVFARIFGKMIGSFLGGTLSGASEPVRKYLGLALAPQAGVAIGLSLLIGKASAYFDFRAVIINITLMAVAINELVGPVLTKIALFRAGEAQREK